MSSLSSLTGGGGDWASLTALAAPTRVNSAFGGDIWQDVASRFTPTSMQDAFRLCEFLYLNFPTYKKGSERVVDYFLTSLKLTDGDESERKKFKETLEGEVKVVTNLRKVGINYMAYGNVLLSPHFPFIREMRCRRCFSSRNAKKVKEFTMDFQTGDFMAWCATCRQTMAHEVRDTAKMSAKEIKLIVWDPKRVYIETNEYTGESMYWFNISEFVKNQVRTQNTFFLSTLPREFLDAIRTNKKVKFDPNFVYHLKESEIAGLDLRGWGPPPILCAFRNFFRLQVLMRQDEKLMLDYITPMRMLSPKQGSYVEGNTIANSGMTNWMSNMGNMISQHRINGANWNLVPFPVEYQAIGGEGQQLSPKELMESEEDRILNARGVPPEFYRASLGLTAAPVALRLFERSWTSLVSGNNDIIQWWSDLISNYMRSGNFKVSMNSVTIVDDIDSKIWRLQAMASELLSKETALSPMGIDAREEYEKLLDQQKFEQRKTEEAEREMEMARISLDSGAEGGGSEGGGAQGAGSTPMDQAAQADQMARELLQMPDGDRHRQLASIRETNYDLHALVLKKMDGLRSQSRSIGQDMAMQQVLQMPPQPQPGQ